MDDIKNQVEELYKARRREIMEKYLAGKSQTELAEEYNCTPQWIHLQLVMEGHKSRKYTKAEHLAAMRDAKDSMEE